MKSYFFVAVGLLVLISKCQGVQSKYIAKKTELDETAPLPPPVVQTQQGDGYNAKISIYHNIPSTNHKIDQSISHNLESGSHRQHRQHATFESVVDKITRSILKRRPLPHEAEELEKEHEAKVLDEIDEMAIAQSERKRKAQKLLENMRRRRRLMADEENTGSYGERQNDGSVQHPGYQRRRRGRRRKGKRKLGANRKHFPVQDSSHLIGNSDQDTHDTHSPVSDSNYHASIEQHIYHPPPVVHQVNHEDGHEYQSKHHQHFEKSSDHHHQPHQMIHNGHGVHADYNKHEKDIPYQHPISDYDYHNYPIHNQNYRWKKV